MNYQEFRKEQKAFLSSDGTIKYVDRGSGDVILLLHGVPTSSWLYRKMIDGLVKAGYRVIAPDMLGFGSSDNPSDIKLYSQNAHAGRILELMDSLDVEQWNHVMHDVGGLWTWELFRKTPNRIKNLVICNTIIYEEGFKPPMRMEEGWIAKFIMSMYRNSITLSFLLKSLFKNGLVRNQLSKKDVQGYSIPLLEGKTNGIYAFFTQTCNEFPHYEDVFNNLNLPIMVVWGKHDTMLQLDPQKANIIAGLKVPPGNIHLLDAKHYIQEEKPEEIVSLILSFLDRR